MSHGSIKASQPNGIWRPFGSPRLVLFVLLGGVIVIATVAVIVHVTRANHAGGDPGGRIMAALQPAAAAVPRDADVAYRHDDGPGWESCDGRAGTFGWGPITVQVGFSSSKSTDQVLAHAEEVLTAKGWAANTLAEPDGHGVTSTWTRSIARSGMSAEVTLSNNEPDGSWILLAIADPVGQRASGC